MKISLVTISSLRRARRQAPPRMAFANIVDQATGEILECRQVTRAELAGVLMFSYENSGRMRSYISSRLTWHSETAVTVFVDEDGLSVARPPSPPCVVEG